METFTPRLILLRHGETEWSANGRHTSRTDLPLIDLGIQQAKAMAQQMAELRLHDPLILTSPRKRAIDTAALAGLVAEHTDVDLAEWDYGDYEGLTTPQIRVLAPGWTVFSQPCPGGEDTRDVRRRADRVLTGLPTERDTVLVGHGHFSRALMARWFQADVATGAHLGMPAAGVAVLGHEREVPLICSISAPRSLEVTA